MNTEEHLVYRKIFKATSLFGGVQGVSMLTSIVRSKVLALLIGTSGYGIYGFLNTIIELFKQFSGLGIETSGVKFISEATDNQSISKYNHTISLLLKLSFALGCFGVLAAICMSPFLSWIVFSDTSKWFVFVFISISVLFNQLVATNNAIFQGSDKLVFLAKSNLYSNSIGLIITLPLFYFFKEDAIIPSIVIISFVNFILSTFYLSKIVKFNNSISFIQSFKEGKEMIRFGSLFVLMGFLPLVVNFALQFFINNKDGLHAVGLFNVSIIVLNTYVGFIFTIMATEYYPRLIKSITSNKSISNTVCQQVTTSLLLVTPVVLFFVTFGQSIIKFLFSNKFIEITPMLNWALFGMVFKSISFSIGYIFIAKADSKIFTKTSLFFNCLHFLLLYLGYLLYGFEGLGIAILVYYFLHFVVIFLIAKKRYAINFDPHLIYLIVASLSICTTVLMIKILVKDNFVYLLSIFICATFLSFYKLKKLISKDTI